tara:strand:+ start:207 stop:938 length:732 start_codon:yes stop_codon:yes gene_type:complete
MQRKKILKMLEDDDQYYNGIGREFLSNSHISILQADPTKLKDPMPNNINFVIGRYVHTAILEPNKLKSFKVIESSTRNTKKYKELSEGEICLLQHEVDKIENMVEKIEKNKYFSELIAGMNIEYEVPNIMQLEDLWWKCKADIVNHDDKLIVDLKTTSDINLFKSRCKRYNYDSQAFIYSSMFGYEFIFLVIDKNTLKTGIFECSTEFYESGQRKVKEASDIYKLFYETENFDPNQYFITKTL